MDWVTASQVATAAGTLVLAVATFGSIRAAKRSTDLAERTLLAGLRPLLVPSRDDDPPERVRFGDGKILVIAGHSGLIELDEDSGNIYMAIALRNGGAGLAVLHGWLLDTDNASAAGMPRPALEAFRRQSRDLYIAPGDTGFWQAAIRDRADPLYEPLRDALRDGRRVPVHVLYGDQQGGQRTIGRLGIGWGGAQGDELRAEIQRVWSVDGVDPRVR